MLVTNPVSNASAELEVKTKEMLELIEEDADSFAQRAEMYYKKRPLLVDMIGDLYRNHRSLAEQFDQLKSYAGSRPKLFGALFVSSQSSTPFTSSQSSNSSISPTSSSCESDSEVDDPEPDTSLETELKRLREENEVLKMELVVKDEEKREVIRQLSCSIDLLKEDNRNLRRHVKESGKKEDGKGGGGFEMMKWTKEIFSGKIFTARCKSQNTVVAL